MYSAMAIFIFILLLMTAFFTSYIMQERKIQAVHETVVSIFAGKDATPTPAIAILPLTRTFTRYGRWPCHPNLRQRQHPKLA